jgi:DNA invertase Pin-like site-specific DNA recombinase
MNTNQSTTEKPRTVYGHLRVSSERQTWGDGERRQDKELMDWCARKGWTLSDRRFYRRSRLRGHRLPRS